MVHVIRGTLAAYVTTNTRILQKVKTTPGPNGCISGVDFATGRLETEGINSTSASSGAVLYVAQ